MKCTIGYKVEEARQAVISILDDSLSPVDIVAGLSDGSLVFYKPRSPMYGQEKWIVRKGSTTTQGCVAVAIRTARGVFTPDVDGIAQVEDVASKVVGSFSLVNITPKSGED